MIGDNFITGFLFSVLFILITEFFDYLIHKRLNICRTCGQNTKVIK